MPDSLSEDWEGDRVLEEGGEGEEGQGEGLDGRGRRRETQDPL